MSSNIADAMRGTTSVPTGYGKPTVTVGQRVEFFHKKTLRSGTVTRISGVSCWVTEYENRRHFLSVAELYPLTS